MNYKTIVLVFLLTFSCKQYQDSTIQNLLSPGNLFFLKSSTLRQVSSFDSTGGNNDRINIPKDTTVTIARIKGPGVISRIWLTIDSRDPYFLRRMVLRIYWDEETHPSVEVPIGDFFGTGFEYRHYYSQHVGMTSGGYFCYFPMPFNKQARIEVANETGQEVYALYYHISYTKLPHLLSKSVAYFHAQWRRDLRTTPGQNYLILDAEGDGHFIGCNLQMQAYRRSLSFLEGDEMVYVDGEKFPSIYGTGTEDYFNSGWYFRNGEFQAPYHGLIIKDDSLSRIAAYRHHITDPIPFKRSIRFTIEHGHANTEICDYSSTAYWYQKEPHKKFGSMPDRALRIPLRAVVPNGLAEAEDLVLDSVIAFKIEDMSVHGPEWSGNKQVRFDSKNFKLVLSDLPERGYTLDIYYSQGPDYGNADIYYHQQKVGKIEGFKPEVLPTGRVRLKNVKPVNNRIELEYVVMSKDPRSSGMAIGIDGFKLEPVREYIPEWMMIGPFPNPRASDSLRYGLDTVYPPENEIDLKRSYPGVDGQQVGWQKIRTPLNGYVTLFDKVQPYELVVTYALTYVYSPVEQEVSLLIGSDDGCKVFLNDREIFKFPGVRVAEPDQDEMSLFLHKGRNKILLKIENNFGGYAFYARLRDVIGNLMTVALPAP